MSGTDALNDPSSARAAEWISEIEEIESELATLKSEYMTKCKAVRAGIAEVKQEAKDEKFPISVLNDLLTDRKLARKRKILKDKARKGTDEVETYEMLVGLLGGLADLPLGQAALEAAPREAAPAAAVDKPARKRRSKAEQLDDLASSAPPMAIPEGDPPPAANDNDPDMREAERNAALLTGAGGITQLVEGA